MTHVDLFSSIGGFALAACANGIRTVQFCEIDSRCRDFLIKAWPGVAIHDDIRTFHWGMADGTRLRQGWPDLPVGEEWGTEKGITTSRTCQRDGQSEGNERSYARNPVYLLTAGVPCQPASRAGKQRGAADDRWLWPEALRVLREVAPAWCLFENPPGIGDLEFDGILSGVEAKGYEVEVLSIPACAVNAPHRRERYWIVAHNKGNRHQAESPEEKIYEPSSCCENMAHTKKDRSKYTRVNESEKCSERNWCSAVARTRQSDWSNFVWLSCSDGKVRRAPDDTVGVVDGLHRSILGALGNSIVPQVAAQVIAAMVKCDHIGDANEMVREG